MTTTIIRKIIESPLTQGKDEKISYQLTTTPWGGTPSVPVVTIYDVTGGIYTALTVLQMGVVMPVNIPTILGDVITLSPLIALTAGTEYRVEIQFISGGDTWEPYFEVHGEN